MLYPKIKINNSGEFVIILKHTKYGTRHLTQSKSLFWCIKKIIKSLPYTLRQIKLLHRTTATICSG
jgi:hypothetical protein